MSHQYQMRLYDTMGAQVAIFDSWNSVYFFNRLSDYGYHTISIDGDDPRVPLFGVDSIIQIMRRDLSANIPWYQEYLGFHRTGQMQVSDRGNKLFSSYGRSVEDLLQRRHIMWRPGDLIIGDGRDGGALSGPADDVMKAYVYYNVGDAARVSSGRMVDGPTLGLSVASNAGLAPAWSGARHYRNVLDVLQEIGAAKSVDFSVEWLGGQNFQFRTYYPQKGVDRTGAGSAAPVSFSLEHANMSQPYATVSRMDEVTSVVVLGQGDGTQRVFVERHNAAELIASPWNRVEFAHDARNEATLAALNDLGDAHLLAHGPDSHLSFQTLQSPASVYGRDYFVGDLVIATFNGVTENRKVSGAEITVSEGKENIRIHFGGE